MTLMELKGIYKSYRHGGFLGTKERHEVLTDIHLGIDPGTCIGLLGRSGSGKSTLGRIILDLESPDKGEVHYYGQPVKTLKKEDYLKYRRNVQVVFQNPLGSVNPRLTAARIIAEPLENFENLSSYDLKTRIRELLERVGLPSTAENKFPYQFSGGELQRICIARAIALQPKLIVLDEAISSLDMLIQAKIIELLIQLQKELDMAYLFISHDIRVLLKISDRLLLMHNGQLVEQADSLEDLNELSHDSFKQLLQAILPPMPVAAKESGLQVTQ